MDNLNANSLEEDTEKMYDELYGGNGGKQGGGGDARPYVLGAGAPQVDEVFSGDIADALLQSPTQDNIALVVRTLMAGKMLYAHAMHSWFEWDGMRWRKETTGKAFDTIRTITRKVNTKGAKGMASASFMAGVEAICKTDRAFSIRGDEFDADDYLLNTPTGVIDLRTGKVRPHDPNDMITKVTLVSPSRDGGKRFIRFLDEITGKDAELIRFLQVSLGACLSGATESHWMLFWTGGGRNGKNTLGDLVMEIMNDYAIKVPSSSLMAKSHEGHPTEIAMLKGVRLAASSEINDGDHWHESRINELTGDKVLSGRFMRGDFFDFRRTHKHLIYGNHRPQLRSVTDALKARIKIVPFGQSFVGREDPDLPERLLTEAGFVLQWLIDGHKAWLDAGKKLPPCAAVDAEAKDYFASQSTVEMWLSERTRTIRGDDRAWNICPKSGELYSDYSDWKKGRNEQPVSTVRWSETMKKLYESGKSDSIRFRGLALLVRN